MLQPDRFSTTFKIGRALTNAEIDSLYRFADKCKVGIVLWQDTPSPARAASTWGVGGKFRHVVRFLWLMRKRYQ